MVFWFNSFLLTDRPAFLANKDTNSRLQELTEFSDWQEVVHQSLEALFYLWNSEYGNGLLSIVVFYLSFVNQFAIICYEDKYIKGDDARPSLYSVGHEMKRPYNVEQKSLVQWLNAVNYLSSQLKFEK